MRTLKSDVQLSAVIAVDNSCWELKNNFEVALGIISPITAYISTVSN